MLATPDVDQERPLGQPRQRLAVQHALGARRQRQRADQDVALRQHGLQPVVAGEVGHAGQMLGAAAPAADRVADGGKHARDLAADLAQPQHAHAAARHIAPRVALPFTAALLFGVQAERAGMAQRHRQHVVGDAGLLAGIDDARDRHDRRQVRRGQQLVDARGGGADQPQLRVGRQHAGLQAPGDDGFDLFRDGGLAAVPHGDIRRGFAQRGSDGNRHERRQVNEDGHGQLR